MPVAPTGAYAYTFTVGKPMTELLPEFTGGNGDLTYSIHSEEMTELSDILGLMGLTFDPATRTISGSLEGTAEDDSTDVPHSITYRATDEDGDMEEITIQINVVDSIPQFAEQYHDPRIVTAGREITPWTLPESISGTGDITYSVEPAMPRGLSFDSMKRQLSGTAMFDGVDTSSFIYTAEDEDGDVATLELEITVQRESMPVAPTAPDPYTYTFTVGEWMAEQLPAFTGGNGELTYSIHSGEMTVLSDILELNGLTFNAATRTISGNLMGTSSSDTTDNPHLITYRTTDLDGDYAEITINIKIVDSFPDFGVQPISHTTAINGVALDTVYLPKVLPGTGTGTLIYSTESVLPDGLTFEDEGETPSLKGTPTSDSPQMTYTYYVTDVDGDRIPMEFTITVEEDTTPAFLSNDIPTVNATENIAIEDATLPTATGGNAPIKYSFNRELPEGLQFNQETQTLFGTPTAGTNQDATSYTYTATDANGDSTVSPPSFIITIAQGDLSSMAIPTTQIIVGVPITPITLPAFTGGRGTITYSLVREIDNADDEEVMGGSSSIDLASLDLPGLTYNAPNGTNSGIISGTLSDTAEDSSGSIILTHSATDADGREGSTVFTISIENRVMSSEAISPATVMVGMEYELLLPKFTGGAGEPYTYSLADASGNVIANMEDIDMKLSGLSYTVNDDEDYPWKISGTIADTATDQSTIAPIILKHCASDSNGNTGFTLFTLTVQDARPSFAVTSIAPILAVSGTELTSEPLPELESGTYDGTPVYSVFEDLPAGLELDDMRRVSGTPSTLQSARTYTYSARVDIDDNPNTTDDGDVVSLTFSLSVTDRQLMSVPINSITLVVGEGSVSHKLPAFTDGSTSDDEMRTITHSLTDADGNNDVSSGTLSGLGLEGLNYNSTSRTISGTLGGTSDIDSRIVTLRHKAVDANDAVATIQFQVIVVDPIPSFGDAPSSLTLQVPFDKSFARYLPQVVDDVGAENTTYTLTRVSDEMSGTDGLPPGLMWYPRSRHLSQVRVTGAIAGKAKTVTETPITYTYIAEDSDGDTASLSITLTVAVDGLQTSILIKEFNVQVGIDFKVSLEGLIDSTSIFTFNLTDLNGVKVDKTDGFKELTYDQDNHKLSGTFLGTPANDNNRIINLYLRLADENGEVSQPLRFYTSGDEFPEIDISTLNGSASSSGFATATIDGETVRVPTHFVSVANGVKYSLPKVIEGSGNGTIKYSLTYKAVSNYVLPGFEHVPDENTLQGSTDELNPLVGKFLVVTATDEDGDTASYGLLVTGQNPSFGDDPFNNLTLTQGEHYSIDLPMATASGYYSLLEYSLNPVEPPGLTFNPTTRKLSGTPTATQSAITYTYTVTGSRDGEYGNTDTLRFTIEVVAPPAPEPDSDSEMMPAGLDETIGLSPPVVEEVMVMSGREMALVVLPDFGYSGPYRLTYSVTGLPQGVEFTPATRMLSGTPQAIGVNEVVYTATDEVGNSGATLFTLTVMDAMLTDATRSAIPAVSTSVAMAATASVASRISQALSGATRGLDITTASGQRFQFDPSSSSGSSGSRRDPLRFGFWFNTATDELSDTRYDVSTNSTTESSNFGFDVSLDFNPDTTLVLGVMQNNSTTETEFRGVGALSGGEGSEGSLALDLNSTALYAALGWRGFSLWAASGDNNTYVAGTTSDVGLPAAFNYQTVGFSADFEVFEDFRIGARVETLQSDFSVPGQGRQLLGDLASASSHTKATLTLNYQLELGRESNGLLTPSFEFGTRDLSTSEQFQTTRSNARDTASELGFGLDYKQLAWGLTLGLDVSSMAVQNYSSQSVRWSVRWESGHHGKGLSLSLAPTTVAQTLGVDNIYNGDYSSYKSLVNRQFNDDSAVSGEGVNVEMGVGFLSGTGTFTPFVKATNLYGSGASTQAFGVRYSAASSTSFELKFTQQSRSSGLGGSGNSLTLGDSASGASSSRDDLEQALEFSTRYSF